MAKSIPPRSDQTYANLGDGVHGGAMGGWVKGIDTIHQSETLDKDQLRNAVNVDIDDVGKLTSRSGATAFIAAPTNTMHSLWEDGDRAFVVDGSTLYEIVDGTLVTVVTGLTFGVPVAYQLVNGEVYYSNGVDSGVIGATGWRRWGVPIPTTVSPGVTSGTLVAGRYSLCTTYNTSVEEGGASPSVVIELLAGSGIVVALPTNFPAGVTSVNLYVSAPDGSVEYLYGTYAAGTVVTVSALTLQKRECLSKFLSPPPAGTALMYYRGRIYIASGNTVYYTEPLRYGAIRLATNFLLFPSEVQLLAATKEQDGFFVSDETQHYFVSGSPEDSRVNFCTPYPAIPRTYIRDGYTDEPVWFTTKGWVTGKAGGVLDTTMASSVAVPKYDTGAALYREESGLRQYVSSFATPAEGNGFSASDYIEAEVIRKGA